MWDAFKIAFSMYSKIPMPKAEWSKNNMKYALCFFPAVGVLVGLMVYFWSIISNKLNIGTTLTAAIFVIIPIIATGGIHVDGFIDCNDAINSYQPMERKLEILKDSHIGAFALITCITYFIIDFGVWSEVKGEIVILLAIGFVLSRALSGLSIVTFPLAKDSGLASTFSNSADKFKVKITMIAYIVLCIVSMLYVNIILGIIVVSTAFLVFLYYRIAAIKKFGGITGDVAGYFLQLCELSMALMLVSVDKIVQFIG